MDIINQYIEGIIGQNCVLFDLSQNAGHGCLKIRTRWTKIAAYLKQLLTDQNAINHLVPITAGERDLLYQDPNLAFAFWHITIPVQKPHHPMITAHHGPFMLKCAAKPKCLSMIW